MLTSYNNLEFCCGLDEVGGFSSCGTASLLRKAIAEVERYHDGQSAFVTTIVFEKHSISKIKRAREILEEAGWYKVFEFIHDNGTGHLIEVFWKKATKQDKDKDYDDDFEG